MTKQTGVQNLNTTTTRELRVILSRHVGKICAYHGVDKHDDAKVWAEKLTKELKRLGLVK